MVSHRTEQNRRLVAHLQETFDALPGRHDDGGGHAGHEAGQCQLGRTQRLVRSLLLDLFTCKVSVWIQLIKT